MGQDSRLGADTAHLEWPWASYWLLAFLAGILLLRRLAWGYLLASVALMKMLTLGASVSAMAINMALFGVEISPVELGIFPSLRLLILVMAVLLLINVDRLM